MGHMATTKTNLAMQKLSQRGNAMRIKTITYLWPCTCHPELLSKSFSILVLSLSEKASSESSMTKQDRDVVQTATL
jgi:hypothetical protein